MSKPPLAKEKGTRVNIQFRLSDEDKNKIRNRAAAAGVSMSDFVRQMALYGFAVQYRADILYDLLVAINRIGTNINQVAKVCNESRSVSPASLQRLQKEHSDLQMLLTRTLVLDEDRAKLVEILGSNQL